MATRTAYPPFPHRGHRSVSIAAAGGWKRGRQVSKENVAPRPGRPETPSCIELPSLPEMSSDRVIEELDSDSGPETAEAAALKPTTFPAALKKCRTVLGTKPYTSPADISPDSEELLDLMRSSLRVASQTRPALSIGQYRSSEVRDTSSSYGDGKEGIDRAKSPGSPPNHGTFRESALEKYSDGNNRLSDLYSSSHETLGEDGTDDAVEDATLAASEWQTEPRAKKKTHIQYEDDDTCHVTPPLVSDEKCAVAPSTTEPEAPQKCRFVDPRDRTSKPSFDSSIDAIKGQYDGGGDAPGFDSPLPDIKPRPASAYKDCGKKRKLSQFSFISNQVPKEAKRFKRIASEVFKEGSDRLRQVRSKLKMQNIRDRRRFEAWKASRRRDRPGDAIKGRPEPGYALFNLERSVHGHEEWWKEGVCKYQAPSWMVFGSQMNDHR